MNRTRKSQGHLILWFVLFVAGFLGFGYRLSAQKEQATERDKIKLVGPADQLVLPKPFSDLKPPKKITIIGWPAGRAPAAPAGFRVTALAENLDNPRMPYVLPGGEVLVAEEIKERARVSANRITLLRDTDGDGRADIRELFLSGLNLPFGMAHVGEYFYVGNTDGVMRYPYQPGQTQITAPGERILELPVLGQHYTRNLLAKPDGSKIYVALGSFSGNGEEDTYPSKRAGILEINQDGSGMRVFASGLRNPTGIAWEPHTQVLWAVVNERGGMGEDTPPDYLTSVRAEGFYGFPFYYWGKFEETRLKEKHAELRSKVLTPDYSIGPHCVPIGVAFNTAQAFPQQYRDGAFVSCRGSTLRSKLFGYAVFFIPFKNGRPVGDPQDFLTGFIADPETGQIYGRPTGVTFGKDGSLLVADDSGNKLWQVTYTGSETSR